MSSKQLSGILALNEIFQKTKNIEFEEEKKLKFYAKMPLNGSTFAKTYGVF
jgi:hypothetical protein